MIGEEMKQFWKLNKGKRVQFVRERASKLARLRLVAIVESSDDAIIGKDLDGIITDWNVGAERLFGYSADEVIGKPISLLIPPECADEFAEIKDKIKRGERVNHHETRRQKKDGTRVAVSLTVSPIIDTKNRIIGATTIARDMTDRKRTERERRESEDLLRMATQSGKMLAYAWDAATDEIVRSEGVRQILGENEGTHTTGKHIMNTIPAEDREKLIAAMAQLSPEKPFLRIKYRMVRSDGNVIWVDRNSRAYFDENGRMLRIIGMLADITDRVRAEEALANVNRRLIEAQELERKRIARELHDNTNQRLALLAVGIDQLKSTIPLQNADIRVRVDQIHKMTMEISNDIQALSHELHSSRLEYLGLALAMRGFCKEFGDKHKVGIKFDSDGMPPTVPQEISLCLFRVMQEGLQNALKHSGVRSFEVKLHGSPTEIRLTIRDSGEGFEPELVKATQGLGLIGMRERVKLVKGTISITSSPQSGTEINVHIPLSEECYSESATA
jgi:PAS domain S-box-containing protein